MSRRNWFAVIIFVSSLSLFVALDWESIVRFNWTFSAILLLLGIAAAASLVLARVVDGFFVPKKP
jgi:hypothetical protein